MTKILNFSLGEIETANKRLDQLMELWEWSSEEDSSATEIMNESNDQSNFNDTKNLDGIEILNEREENCLNESQLNNFLKLYYIK